MTERFNYVDYDAQSKGLNEVMKSAVESLAMRIENMPVSRERQLALTALEECFMWVGKAIRDAQIQRQAAKD